MTIAIIEKQIAQTRDRLDRAAAQLAAVAADFKRHCYAWHVEQSKQSQAQIEQLRLARQRLVEEQELLAGALAGLEQRKAEAQQATNRADALVHINRVNELLTTVHD
jgi:chromosome segregation ATPase